MTCRLAQEMPRPHKRTSCGVPCGLFGTHESNQIVRTANNSLNILGVLFIGAAGSCQRRQAVL